MVSLDRRRNAVRLGAQLKLLVRAIRASRGRTETSVARVATRRYNEFGGEHGEERRIMTTSVDEWVNSKILSEHQETVTMLRALVRECAPRAEELISYNMPVFKAGGQVF